MKTKETVFNISDYFLKEYVKTDDIIATIRVNTREHLTSSLIILFLYNPFGWG